MPFNGTGPAGDEEIPTPRRRLHRFSINLPATDAQGRTAEAAADDVFRLFYGDHIRQAFASAGLVVDGAMSVDPVDTGADQTSPSADTNARRALVREFAGEFGSAAAVIREHFRDRLPTKALRAIADDTARHLEDAEARAKEALE